jgi:hypothetical protein
VDGRAEPGGTVEDESGRRAGIAGNAEEEDDVGGADNAGKEDEGPTCIAGKVGAT